MKTLSPITANAYLLKSRRETEIAIAEHNAWFDNLGPRFFAAFCLSLRIRWLTVEYVGPHDRVLIRNGVLRRVKL